MSTIVLLILVMLIIFFLPPLISGLAGSSIKFTLYYSVAVTLFTYFAKLINYVHDGKSKLEGMPPLSDYALSEILMTLLVFVMTLALSSGLYCIGHLMRRAYNLKHTAHD